MEFYDTVVTHEAKEKVLRCLNSGRLSEGKAVDKFEKELERVFGMSNVVVVNSCTSALHLALILAGVGEGDEVILPAQTFVATALPILYCGAKPVFADIEMDGGISVEDMNKKITDRTKAVIGVSWGGNPCDLYALSMLERTEISFIQDNAQALGATYYDRPLSAYGDFSCYSFQAIKHLTTGDGGALTCALNDDYDRARKLRWFGIDREKDVVDETGERNYNLTEIGYKYQMNNVAASIGLGNMHFVEWRLKRVREIAKIYDEQILSGFDHCKVEKKEGCAYWLYDMLVPNRPGFIQAMRSRGIPVSVVHVGIDRNDLFGGKQDLPNQRYWDEHHVCLPIHSNLTDKDVEQVVKGVCAGW